MAMYEMEVVVRRPEKAMVVGNLKPTSTITLRLTMIAICHHEGSQRGGGVVCMAFTHRADKGPAETHSHCNSYSQPGLKFIQGFESMMMAMAMCGGGKERDIQLMIMTMTALLVSKLELITQIFPRAT